MVTERKKEKIYIPMVINNQFFLDQYLITKWTNNKKDKKQMNWIGTNSVRIEEQKPNERIENMNKNLIRKCK